MSNPLEGKRLRYLIDGVAPPPSSDHVVECGYDDAFGEIAYCNLFDEKNNGTLGPYLHTSDTAAEYHEGQIDPRGDGWRRNLTQQFARRKAQGLKFIELDNPDAYHVADVIAAVELAGSYDLMVIAKNPLLVEQSARYLGHRNVYGAIVEKGAGTCDGMQALRQIAGKPLLPVWFVAFGAGLAWAKQRARVIAENRYINMSVSYSRRGEYQSAEDVQ